MTTWLFKLLAQLTFTPRTQPVATRHAAIPPQRGACTASENTGEASSYSIPPDRTAAPSALVKGKPLRIIEWVESASGHHPSSRRMVMSGRLADICAELDRLAALEA